MSIRTLLFAATAALTIAAVAGCDDGETGTTAGTGGTGAGNTTAGSDTGGTAGTGGTGGTGGDKFPAAPSLGAKQIDRMGRPAINTAGNNTFNPNPEQAEQAKMAYNGASDPSKWADFTAEVQKNLAILDSLDLVCGNQLLADPAKNDPSRYAGLAGVLVDDRLYVNSEGDACTGYLFVEANALGITNNDCGGRRLAYDVIDVSYTILVSGALDASIGDTIDISASAQGEKFPHLVDPN